MCGRFFKLSRCLDSNINLTATTTVTVQPNSFMLQHKFPKHAVSKEPAEWYRLHNTPKCL